MTWLRWAYPASRTPSVLAGRLYILSAILPCSTVLYTRMVMVTTVGALVRRAEKLAGPGSGTLAEAFAVGDKSAIVLEERVRTQELIRRWAAHN